MLKQSKKIYVGGVPMGGDAPIVVQSMTNTPTADVDKTVAQILQLESAGCELVRVAVPNIDAANAIGEIKRQINIPLVADIHFDYRLALRAIKQGIDKIRINPGNIGDEKKVKKVISACKEREIPIRIGVNVGSIEKESIRKYENPTVAAVESCLRHVKILEDNDFDQMVLSVKFNNVLEMISGYRMLADRVTYPLHLGVTHAGTPYRGTIKNAIGIATLLMDGIGATMRVSLAGDPVLEIKACWAILSAIELRQRGPEIIACPTCGRTEVDVIGMAEEIEAMLVNVPVYFKVAIMGCVVNGPKEASDADIGIAGGRDKGLLFAHGERISKARGRENMLDALKKEIQRIIKEKSEEPH